MKILIVDDHQVVREGVLPLASVCSTRSPMRRGLRCGFIHRFFSQLAKPIARSMAFMAASQRGLYRRFGGVFFTRPRGALAHR